ncbi:hypothetical protein E2C01_037378 [Portunus trituberculatus]|uniref:Uncharacterized protein n=1 Tax=Portunus trituberculatus TaxID=210409 RepID=A0A5B7FEG7_PORTR|nr:hypothetical protein [Portunus trituberculatus]
MCNVSWVNPDQNISSGSYVTISTLEVTNCRSEDPSSPNGVEPVNYTTQQSAHTQVKSSPAGVRLVAGSSCDHQTPSHSSSFSCGRTFVSKNLLTRCCFTSVTIYTVIPETQILKFFCAYLSADETLLKGGEDFDTILTHIGMGKWNIMYYFTIGACKS